MFEPTTECVDSLTIDDVTGQAVPESGTGRTECSVADSCEPHSWYLQSMCPHWSEPMPARHVSYADEVVGQVLWSQSMQRSENQHRQLELYALRRAQPVKAGERVGDVVWAPKASDGSGSDTRRPGFRSGWRSCSPGDSVPGRGCSLLTSRSFTYPSKTDLV